MTNSEDNPPPAIGTYWIREEDYPALLQLFDDGDKMPPSWKEWLKVAEEMEQGLKAYGHIITRHNGFRTPNSWQIRSSFRSTMAAPIRDLR